VLFSISKPSKLLVLKQNLCFFVQMWCSFGLFIAYQCQLAK
jgi:hypothetical protein